MTQVSFYGKEGMEGKENMENAFLKKSAQKNAQLTAPGTNAAVHALQLVKTKMMMI